MEQKSENSQQIFLVMKEHYELLQVSKLENLMKWKKIRRR